MADSTILESFVELQERKLHAKVDAIAHGGQMAVTHQIRGSESLGRGDHDIHDAVYDLKFVSRHSSHDSTGMLKYEITPR